MLIQDKVEWISWYCVLDCVYAAHITWHQLKSIIRRNLCESWRLANTFRNQEGLEFAFMMDLYWRSMWDSYATYFDVLSVEQILQSNVGLNINVAELGSFSESIQPKSNLSLLASCYPLVRCLVLQDLDN